MNCLYQTPRRTGQPGNVESPFKMAARWIGMLSVIVILAGCIVNMSTTPANPEMAAKMTLDQAANVIERAGTNGMTFGNADEGFEKFSAYTEFDADRLRIFLRYDNAIHGRDQHERLIIPCQYERLEPVIENNDIHRFSVATGCGGEEAYTRRYYVLTSAQTNMAAALLRFHVSTPGERRAWLARKEQDFAKTAQDYRNANPKPVLPEEVLRFNVIALSAVREKHFLDAAQSYEQALAIAPWWPEGQFNAALMWAQVGFLHPAVDHMKKYLLLVPDAANARAAQDKIYEWEHKADQNWSPIVN